MDVDEIMRAAPAGPSPALRYDGRVGEIYNIFLPNLLLTIVTLGIYRFWAITRMRRYLWSRTSFQGERLSYTGRGGELFVGFLLAGLLLLGLGIAAAGLTALAGYYDPRLAPVPLVLLYVTVLVLALGAPYSAQRYRLSRTEWCGIRGAMSGSMMLFGLRSLLYWALVPLTLFQLMPWVHLRLAERRISASSLGSAHFQARFSAGRIYGRFLLTWIGIILLGAAIAALIWATAGSTLIEDFRSLQAAKGGTSTGQAEAIGLHLALIIFAAEFCFIVGAAIIGAAYRAFVLRHMADNSALGPVQLSGQFTAGGLLWLVIGNMLIIVLTLGLGYPFVLNRYARFVCNNICASGSLDPAALRQSEQRVPAFGEGLFQQLDAGGGVF